jgi:glycosyltransferase involved in cell wall biosynthesis
MKKLSIIISTLDFKLLSLESYKYPSVAGVEYVLVVQFEVNPPDIPVWVKNRKDFCLVVSRGLGLSKSRNIGISNAKFQYCLITDDDVMFEVNTLKSFLDYLNLNGKDSIYILKIICNNHPFREYKPFEGNRISVLRNILSTCSVEICFPRKIFKNIKFNECIGLGTSFPLGEDTLFCKMAFDRDIDFKLYEHFVPILENSNHTGMSRAKDVVTKQGVFAAYIWKWNFLFWIKKIVELILDVLFIKKYKKFYYLGLIQYLRNSAKYDSLFSLK